MYGLKISLVNSWNVALVFFLFYANVALVDMFKTSFSLLHWVPSEFGDSQTPSQALKRTLLLVIRLTVINSRDRKFIFHNDIIQGSVIYTVAIIHLASSTNSTEDEYGLVLG